MNDAFGCVHRSHASVDAITQYMPSYVGNLLDEELTNLHSITEDPESPSITILGGSKISTKISVLKNLSIKMDSIVICGAGAYGHVLSSHSNLHTPLPHRPPYKSLCDRP